ncbi:MAG: DUF2059 domain-containing protein [Sphingobium sp.]
MRIGSVLGAAIALAVAPIAQAQAPVTAPAAQAIDPARLAAAQKAVTALVPDGVYARMMRDQYPAMMEVMMREMMGMKGSEMGQPDQAGKTMAELAREHDPAFEERMRIMTRVMGDEMGTVMGQMEPGVRAGLSRAFARRFTAPQLADMNRFFMTPSGKAFANDYLLMFADPEMMREMAALAPQMMRAMPAVMDKVKKATAHLPPPPKPKDAQTD